MAGKLPGRAISNTANIVSQTITVGNSTSNSVINSTAVATPSVNVGSNVFVNTSTIHLGNSTVNTVIHTTGFTGNGAGLHGINASSIATGTLDTARLPSTVNVSSAINVGANLNINTSTIFIGNSTVNTTIIAGNVDLQGTQLRVGNVIVNGNQLSVGNVTITDAQISVGNSTSNIVLGSAGTLSGNGSQLTSVNAIALQGNSVSDILTSANTAANTLASAAFSNAASRVDSAYSNAVAYANTTFLPLAGGTMTGSLTVNATANIVSNLSANNVTFRGNVQIDGNLVVSGTSVTLNVASFAVEDNILHLNNGSTETHPDLGLAGNYNDGTYKHAGIFRDATDGVWKVFDGYTPEPNTAFIDTSNASFRIAHFTANVITANSFSGNGASVTSVDAATVGGNTASTLRSYSDTVSATAFTNAASRADSAYSNATSYADTKAAAAFSNAATRADSAYSNAVAYAASNSYVNSTFLPLAGGTLTGTLTLKAISSNGSVGTAGQLLASNGTSTYWIDPPASTNVNAQYTWTNTHTFSNTVSIAGNLNFSSTGQRITGDMSNGTFTSRLAVQTNVTNAVTNFHIIPNGTAVGSGIKIEENNTFTNCSRFTLDLVSNTDARISSGVFGTGTYLPVTIHTGGGEKFRVAANGNVGIGNTTPAQLLTVGGSIRAGVAGNSSANFAALEVAASGTGDAQAAIAIQQVTTEGDTIIFADYEPFVEWGISTENTDNLVQFTGGSATGSLVSKTLYNRSGTARTAYSKFQVNLGTGVVAVGGNMGIGTTSPGAKLEIVGNTTAVAVTFGSSVPNNPLFIGTYGNYSGIGMDQSTAGVRIAGDYSGSNPVADMGYYTSGSVSHANWVSRLKVSANGNVTVAGTLTESSSATIKENIDPIQNALGLITSLTGYTYDRKDGSAKNRAGLIAEEVERVLPNVVQKDDNGNPSSIAYTNLIAYLVESIKELKQEIDILKGK